MKTDIEGAEIEVIRQSLDLLQAIRPPLVMESHRVDNIHSAAVCADMLRGIGYTVSTSSGQDGLSDYLLYAR